MNVDDVLTQPWGQDRFSDFYNLIYTPALILDGEISCASNAYPQTLAQRLGVPTDVTIELSGTQTSGARWDVSAEVCVESGGSNRTMRIQAAATLSRHPDAPAYSRNLLMQEVLSEDISLSGGNCQTVVFDITFDGTSWSNRSDITVIAWAQEPDDSGPAAVYQAGIMNWPFPEPEVPELTSIEISPSTAELAVGETLTYTATGKDQNGQDFELTDPVWWTSGDGEGTFEPERGSSTPVLTATYPGTANITCTQDGVTGGATLEITGDAPALASITIVPASPDLGVGESRSLTAVGYDQYGDEFPLSTPSWTIEGEGDGTFDPAVGNADTLFTATRPGNAQILCTDGDVIGQTAVTISGDPPELAVITINPASATIDLGGSQAFAATGTDQYGDPWTLSGPSWSIMGDGDGHFDPAGGTQTTLTTTAAGSCVVTAEEEGVEGTATVEISDQDELPKPRRLKKRYTPS